MNAESLSILILPCNEEKSVGELPTREIEAPLPDSLDCELVIPEEGKRIFDSLVWLWCEPASIIAIAKRRAS